MTTIYWGISHLFISEEGRDRIRFSYNLQRQPFDAGDGITIALASAIPPEIQAQVRSWADQEWDDPDGAAYVYDSGMYWLVVTGPPIAGDPAPTAGCIPLSYAGHADRFYK